MDDIEGCIPREAVPTMAIGSTSDVSGRIVVVVEDGEG